MVWFVASDSTKDLEFMNCTLVCQNFISCKQYWSISKGVSQIAAEAMDIWQCRDMIRAMFPVTGPVDIIWPTMVANSIAETCVFLRTLFNVEISFSLRCKAIANAPSMLVRPSQVIFWVGAHIDFSSFATKLIPETSALRSGCVVQMPQMIFPCLSYHLEI